MQLVKQKESGHWYELTQGGEVVPRYDATLRDARKFKYFPSPTTIERDTIANPTLARWIKNEMAKAFLKVQRGPEETDENYVARVMKEADEVSLAARNKGTEIHKMIEDNIPLLGGPTFIGDAAVAGALGAFMAHASIVQPFQPEIMLADAEIGVAGRTDLVANRHSWPIIIDFKTQNVRKKATFYESFPRQLSFYARAYAKKLCLPRDPSICSVVIDSNNPGRTFDWKVYTAEEQREAYREFLCSVYLWCRQRDYWPGSMGKWSMDMVELDSNLELEIK